MIRYVASILTAFVGICVLIDGVAKRLGAGVCDQCSGDQGPGNRLLAIGFGLLVVAVVITIATWINTAADDNDEQRH